MVVTIDVAIALIHIFRIGSYSNDPWYTFYYSYFSDIIIPVGFYFLLCINEFSLRFLVDWRVKASITEILQPFGVTLLGLTFDPLDFVMFGARVLLAEKAGIWCRIYFLECIGWALPEIEQADINPTVSI